MSEAAGDQITQNDAGMKELRDRKPNFIRVTSSDQRTEQEKTEGAVLFRDLGYMDIRLDPRAFSQLLRENGLTPEQISRLEVTFRAGSSADRDFHGGIIGGWNQGNQIEIYTTLPVTDDRVTIYSVPIRSEALADSLLHEMRHYIQEQTGMGSHETFMATAKEQHADPLEQDARKFEVHHRQKAMTWFELSETPGFEDNLGEERVVGRLARCGEYYNLDRRLTLFDPDNTVLYLEEEIERDIIRHEKGVRVDRDYLGWLVGKARLLVEERKLGFSEYNGIFEKLASHFGDLKQEELKAFCLANKYQ
jgi:hypothetical protein